MVYRYIAIDLDGTLLDSHKRISQQNADTINRLQSEGVQFIFISGRHYHEIIEPLIANGIADIHYIVSRDGQYIYKDGNVIYEGSHLFMNDIKSILLISGARHVFCSNNKQDYTIYRSTFCFVRAWLRNRQGDGTIHLPLILAKLKKCVVGKAIFFNGELKDSTICTQMRQNFTIHFVNNREYDVFPKDVNKYASLQWLSKHENIHLDNLLYFGDDYNDIECFEHLPHCVVMGNASDSLKRYSIYPDAPSNNQSGVAVVLEKIMV